MQNGRVRNIEAVNENEVIIGIGSREKYFPQEKLN
jgi:hypothetical protein